MDAARRTLYTCCIDMRNVECLEHLLTQVAEVELSADTVAFWWTCEAYYQRSVSLFGTRRITWPRESAASSTWTLYAIYMREHNINNNNIIQLAHVDCDLHVITRKTNDDWCVRARLKKDTFNHGDSHIRVERLICIKRAEFCIDNLYTFSGRRLFTERSIFD